MIELNTPALLFPAVSLLMLAYTNRFLALGSLIRKLHSDYLAGQQPAIKAQIDSLRLRMRLIRQMQLLGILSLLMCMISLIVLLLGWREAATGVFAVAVMLLAASLVQCFREVLRSGGALDILLHDLEAADAKRRRP